MKGYKRVRIKSETIRVDNQRASMVAQIVKNLSAVREIWVRSLSWEDPLEEGMTTNSSILAWKIPRAEESGRL